MLCQRRHSEDLRPEYSLQRVNNGKKHIGMTGTGQEPVRPEQLVLGHGIENAMKVVGRGFCASYTAISRMIRVIDGVDDVDVVSEQLQRKYGSFAANVAVRDMRLDRQDAGHKSRGPLSGLLHVRRFKVSLSPELGLHLTAIADCDNPGILLSTTPKSTSDSS